VELEVKTADQEMPAVDAPPLSHADNHFVCQCMSVARDDLVEAVRNGAATVKALSAQTGAGTACGGCLPKLAEFTAETLWSKAKCLEIVERNENVRSFRFQIPESLAASGFEAGQRLVVQAQVQGVAVQRPYTLTSPSTCRDYYEITVQREPDGVFSNWLFDGLKVGDEVSLLPPGGSCFFISYEPRPLVCLVGGIGLTPALGIARSFAAIGSKRRVHIEHSVTSREKAICDSELEAYYPSTTFRLRLTGEEGRITSADVLALSRQFADADWLICGSPGFRDGVRALLEERGIVPHRIHIESFTASNAPRDNSRVMGVEQSQRQRTIIGALTLAAIAAFAAQALFVTQWPLLHRLQTSILYSALTGVVVILLVLLQWRLSYARALGSRQDTSRAYGLHIAIGPIVLGAIWLHSTHFGYALSMAVSVSFLLSLASGAVLGARPRSEKWKWPRRITVGSHILLTCAGSGLALVHGFTALWF
jgi:ferredoxin-NADP reductase